MTYKMLLTIISMLFISEVSFAGIKVSERNATAVSVQEPVNALVSRYKTLMAEVHAKKLIDQVYVDCSNLEPGFPIAGVKSQLEDDSFMENVRAYAAAHQDKTKKVLDHIASVIE